MRSKHLHKILLSLQQKPHNKFANQILTQAITAGLTHATSTWNCLVRAYSNSPTPISAVLVYNYSIKNASNSPDNYTYPPLLRACSRLVLVSTGKQVHAHVIKRGLDCDVYVQNAFIHFYGTVRHFTDARELFDRMPHRDVATWNSIMGVCNGNLDSFSVMGFFRKLLAECFSFRPDSISLVVVLSACGLAEMEGLEYGKAVHGYVIKAGLGWELNVNNALLDMYTKSKQMGLASKVYDEMGSGRDVVSYTILINGYAKIGSIELARDVFDQIVPKDIVLWNTMVHAHVKANRPDVALELFKKMDDELVIPDKRTMVSVIGACASLSDLQCGRLVHRFVNRNNNITRDVFVTTALIDMYSKCGSVEDALATFYKMEHRDVFTWTTMVEGLANNGFGNEALSMFNQMEKQGMIQPNEATFLSGLKACTHWGLVDEGCRLFEKMVETYKLQPAIAHFGCLIDLLSRAGLLYQAEEFINLLQPEDRFIAYKTLLSACIKYSEFSFGEKVANEMVKLSSQSQSHASQIMISNFYALAGQWSRVAESRRVTEGLNVRKEPGISSSV